MRARTALLLAAAVFGAGFLLGRSAAPKADEPRRGATRNAAAGLPGREGETAEEPAGAAQREPDPDHATAPGVRPAPESPERDQPLEPGPEFDSWSGMTFARWYAVHRKAWDLPDLEGDTLEKRGDYLLRLGRIPRRDVLVRLLLAMEEWDKDVERVAEESSAWHEANPDAPEDDPGAVACVDAMRAVHQRLFDGFHAILPYPDYLILLHEAERRAMILDGVKARPPDPGRSGDAYVNQVEIVRGSQLFLQWYRAYAPLLGLPERDEAFLDGFHRLIVLPLGRLPDAPLMRTLEEVYAPLHWRLTSGEHWADAVKQLFTGLDRVLDLLDYERVRHSSEWGRYRDTVPPPADR